MVATLRANSSVPYCVIPDIVDHCNQIVSTTVSAFKAATVSSREAAGLDTEVIKTVEMSLNTQASSFEQPVNFLATRHKQDKHFDSHPLAVKPESIVLGHRIDTHSGHSRLVYETFQYISVEATLRSLLQSKAYVEAILSDKAAPGVVKNWHDGIHFGNHSMFADKSKLVIMLELFYDGMGTTNPLHGQSVTYNIGVFYFTVKNLPNVYNSCFANVHLLALCNTNELKMYGFDPVLRKFVDELLYLGHFGFSGDFPIIGSMQIYVCLGNVTCDNMALNGILGFI